MAGAVVDTSPFPLEALPLGVLAIVLCKAGAWRMARGAGVQAAWSVCRGWCDLAWRDPAFPGALARCMTELRGSADMALMRACCCRPEGSRMVDLSELARTLLGQEGDESSLASPFD
jgi:hypothetical protein